MRVSGNFSIPTALNSIGNMLTENIRKKEMTNTVREHLKNTIYHMKANRFTFFGLRKYFDPLFAAKEKADMKTLKALDDVNWVENVDDIATILKVHCSRLSWFDRFEGHTRNLISICDQFFNLLAKENINHATDEKPYNFPIIDFRKMPLSPQFITGSQPQGRLPSDGYHIAIWQSPDINESIKYEGEWKDGLPHGKGCMTIISSDDEIQEIYEGQFEEGLPHGKGYFEKRDNFYEGDFRNNFFHGEGHRKFNNGDHYQGQYVKGIRTGKGLIKSLDNECYEGQFKNNIPNGYGVYKWSNGEKYEGDFENGMFHGSGCYIWLNGRKFTGGFKNGELQGSGLMIWPDGTQKYIDSIVNGRFWADVTFKNGIRATGWFLNGALDNSHKEQLTDEALTKVTFKNNTWQGKWIKNYFYPCEQEKIENCFTDCVTYEIMDDPVFLPVKCDYTDEKTGFKYRGIDYRTVPVKNDKDEITDNEREFANGWFYDKKTIDNLIEKMKKEKKTYFKNPMDREVWTEEEFKELLVMDIEQKKNNAILNDIQNSRYNVADLCEIQI